MYEDLTVVIPTINEEDCIENTVKELKKYSFNNILIIDAQSIDKTIQIAKELGCKTILQKSNGYGGAVIEALKEVNTEYVTFFDADGSYDPKSLSTMYDELVNKNFEFIFCSRYKDGLRSDDDTFIRYLGNFFFTKFLSLLFSIKITDFLFHYAMASKKNYDKLNLKYHSFSLCCEVPIKAKLKGYKIKEIPSKERARSGGISKVNAFKDGLIILFDMLKLFFDRSSYR
jgi:glycosyltransferase involved in cell wall biosynthesis